MVAAELIGAPSGLGYAIEWYRGLLMTPKVMAFIATIGVLGFLTDALLRALNRRLTPWVPDSASVRDGTMLRRIRSCAARSCRSCCSWSGRSRAWRSRPAHAAALEGRVSSAAAMIASGDLPARDPAKPRRACSAVSRSPRCIAVPLGLAMGSSRAVERNLDPLIESFRPVAAIAILPLAILWFGTGTAAAVRSWPTRRSFRSSSTRSPAPSASNPTLLQAAATMGLARLTTLRTVVVPGALPSIGVGLRIALGVAWTAIIAAELAVGAKAGGGGSGGIGQMMFVFYAYSIELNRIVVCMIAVGLVALAARPRAARAALAAACRGAAR